MSTRARTLVVVVVVLLSVLAGVAAGSAAGEPINGDNDANSEKDAVSNLASSGSLGQATADGALSSGETFWQGSRLEFTTSGIDGEVELWRVTADGQLNQQVRSIALEEDGSHVLETGSLIGRYVLRHDGEPVAVDDGTARSTGATVAGSAFRIERQTLSFDVSDPTVYPGQATTLTVESNREHSVAAVSGADLSYENLTAIVPATVYADDHDVRADEDVLLVSLSATTTLTLETAELPSGSPPLVFDVVDTTARSAAAVTVLEPDADRRFRSIDRREQVGDVVEAELACTHCFVVVGGPDQGFLDVVEVRDEDDDDVVTLRVNTRYAGMATSATGYPSGVEAYTSPADSVERYSSSDDLEAVQESLNYDVSTLNDLRTQQGLEANGRYSPIEPGPIRLTVSSSDFVIDRSAYGSGAPTGSDLVVRDETDVRLVTLEPRSLDGVETLAAPGESTLDVTADSLADVAGPRERVALGDRLAFRIDASGLSGYLDAEGSTAEGTSLEALLDNDAEGIDLELERLDERSETIRLDRVATEVVADGETDSLYLVFRTGSGSSNWLAEGEYRASLTLEGVPAEFDEYSTRDGHAGYPYLGTGERETVSGTVTLTDPTAAITTPESSDAYLTADDGLRVEGTTSVAAGTTLAVEATSTEFAWDTRRSTDARPNGTWTAELDLAGAPGDEFEIAVLRGDERLDVRTYAVHPPEEEPAPEEGSSEGESEETAGDTTAPEAGSSVAGIPIPGLGGLSGLAVPLGGAAGGLVFVWGAWRFVIRRFLL